MSAQHELARHVGRYQLLECIGSGAQGTVYRAHDPRLERHVAVKLLLPGPHADTICVDGAYAEARAAARLNHPNVASIFDFGDHEGCPYMVFEHVPGTGMDTILKERGRLPENEAWRLMMGVLAGIDHAHDQGVVHLDLKPGNIRVTDDGTPKVLDFGMAQFFSPNGHKPRSAGGTLRFMAPEHFADEELGTHTDVFALSLILFELLTGKRAVRARSWEEVRLLLFTKGIDLSPLVEAGVPDEVNGVISAGVKTDRSERIPTAGAYIQALRAARGDGAQPAYGAAGDDRAVQFVMRRLRSRGDLPAFPRVMLDVNRMTADNSDATVDQIANVVMRDHALTARLLRLANSAINATRVKATRITDAISRLGLEQVRVAANGMGYFASMTSGGRSSTLRDAVLKSFASGLVARHFAQSLELAIIEEAFLCGMLFNTGEHLVIHCLPEEYEEICACMDDTGDAAKLAASRAVLGVDYARLGAVVAETWNLPTNIVGAIGYRALDCSGSDDSQAVALARLAASGTELCEFAVGTSVDCAAAGLAEMAARYREDLGLSEDSLMQVIVAAAKKMQRFAPALGVAPESSDFLKALSGWCEPA